MGRGVSSGGGQSSLGYLFGSDEAPKPAAQASPPADNELPKRSSPAPQQVDITKQIPAGIHGNPANNYHRADGQNTGNFLTV